MKNYKVVLEIELNAENPLEAAKNLEDWVRNGEVRFDYVVQEEDGKIHSVDLSEDEEDSVLPNPNYIPLIQPL